MTEQEYDQLFRLLNKLKTEAPCHNCTCVGHMNCDYNVSGYYGEECAIKVVTEEASYRHSVGKLLQNAIK